MNNKIPAGENQQIGLDLGDHRHPRFLDADDEISAEEAIANTREVLISFGARYPGAKFVMETGTHRSAHCPSQAGTRSHHAPLFASLHPGMFPCR